MIAASPPSGQLDSLSDVNLWQRELARAVTDPQELLTLLGLDSSLLAGARAAGRQFSLRVPRGFVARMRPGDPGDPLLRQVLPLDAECQEVAGFGMDPVGDLASRLGPGLLHKYSGRALLITTGACAVHCRYCFRRHFPYAEQTAASGGWEEALASLRHDTSIHELILSGGDPLSLSTRRLAQLTQGLCAAPHIHRLRIHSRYPIVLPERIDAGLLDWLAHLELQKVMVIHANHANELDTSVARACRELTAVGVTLLNQSVLLAGVNDSATALGALSERLFAMQVLPYYLHLLDRVHGAAHFDVPESRAVQLIQTLMSQSPGYLVPRLVREISGAPSKVPIRIGSAHELDPGVSALISS